MMQTPLVSIVIPVFNSAELIKEVVLAAKNQSYKEIEVIVVDDGSTDATEEIVKALNGVIYLKQVNAGPAAARNLGARHSKGEVIFFTDSDCVADENWIKIALEGFKSDKIGVVAGSYGIANKNSLLAQCIHDEIIYRHEKLMPEYPKSFGSYNFGIRKDLFNQIGGFNAEYKNASGEDNDLSYKVLKAGYKIYFERKAKVNHYHPQELYPYLKSQFRHGFWRVKMYKDHPDMVTGDDYTFWKDAAEVLLAGIILVGMVLSIINTGFLVYTAFLIFLLSVIEIYYSCVISCTNNRVRNLLFFMMFIRSYARMLGFSAGIFNVMMASKKGK